MPSTLKARIEAIRLKAGPLMNLGDVAEKSVPKMMLVAPPRHGGAVTVRSLHPAPRPCLDRRARRGQRRHRLPDRGLARRRRSQRSPRAGARPCRSSIRPARRPACSRSTRPASVIERGDAAHRAQADGRKGVRMSRDQDLDRTTPPSRASCRRRARSTPMSMSSGRGGIPVQRRRPNIIPRMRRPKCCSRCATVSASRATSSSRRAATAPTTRRRSTRIAQSDGKARGVAVVDPAISDDGAAAPRRRRHPRRPLQLPQAPRRRCAQGQVPRCRQADRAARLARRRLFRGGLLDELRPFLEAIPTIIVVDHLGRPDVAQGPDGTDISAFSACSTSIRTSGPR